MEAISEICELCGIKSALCESHIIPKFVTEHQKRTSATGFIRINISINRRKQDGLKCNMLCKKCEAIFNQWETPFAKYIYHPYNNHNPKMLEYDSWCLKFATSVSWRAMKWYMKNSQDKIYYSDNALAHINNALKIWKGFMLNQRQDVADFEQHILLCNAIERTTSIDNLPSNINRFLTRGTVISLAHLKGTSDSVERPLFIFVKMGKVMLLGFIGINDTYQWIDTKIHSSRGFLGGNVSVPKPFWDYIIDQAKYASNQYRKLSPKQESIISKTMETDMNRLVRSEIFEMMNRDVEMFGQDSVFDKDK